MIEEFKDIIETYFKSQNKVINREDIYILFYKESEKYTKGIFVTSLPDFEYYEIIYDNFDNKNELILNIYQKIRECRITKNEE